MKKSFETPNKAEPATTVIYVVGFVSVLMLGAVVRLTGHPLNWCNNMAPLILTQTTLLDGDAAFRAERMVDIDILIDRFLAALQKAVVLIVYAVSLVMMFVIIRQGPQLCANVGEWTLEGIPFLNYVWAAAFIPAGLSLMLITAIKRLYDPMKTTDSTVISKM